MTKTGRNDPCPCGSGKKFKRCCLHGSQQDQAADETAGKLKPDQTEASIDRVGTPGLPTYLILQNVFEKGDPRNLGGPGGVPGPYRVVFTLGRPGFSPRREGSLSFESGLEGDSHLAIAPPAATVTGGDPPVKILVQATTPEGTFILEGLPNKAGFLGKLVLESIEARDLKDACRRATATIGGFLSTVAVYSDIPLHIYQVDATEHSTGNTAVLYVNSYAPAAPGRLPATGLDPEFRLYAALYREALGSNSPSYQFLCLFKIIEGIQARNVRKVRESLEQGLPVPSKPRELIPATKADQLAWLATFFPPATSWDEMTLESTFPAEAVGKKVNRVVEDILRPVRDQVAHTFLDSGEATFSIDDPKERDAVLHWLPLTKCIARALIRNEFPGVFS